MGSSMRWLVTIPQQLLYTAFLGLVGPYSISVATGLDTLWFLPVGLTFGSWLGAWLVWPRSRRLRTLILLAAAGGTVAGLFLLTIGLFSWISGSNLGMVLTLTTIAVLPIVAADGAILFFGTRASRS